MFGVAIDIALKVAVKSNYVLQRTFINFNKPQFQTGLTKSYCVLLRLVEFSSRTAKKNKKTNGC